jgi:hypothetical protein
MFKGCETRRQAIWVNLYSPTQPALRAAPPGENAPAVRQRQRVSAAAGHSTHAPLRGRSIPAPAPAPVTHAADAAAAAVHRSGGGGRQTHDG